MGGAARWGARCVAAAVVTAVPVALGSLGPILGSPDAGEPVHVFLSSAGVTQPTPPTSAGRRPDLPRPQAVATAVTIDRGIALRTPSERHRRIAVSSAKGSRVWTASALSSHDLPTAAVRAYRHAAHTLAAGSGCSVPWTLLAGIGRVESDHGRYAGSVLGRDGVSRPPIIGVALDGAGPVAAVRDTDGGRLDGDRTWDRAVGPMQFLPSTWRIAGRDGDGDGRRSPDDLDDAALTAAGYLCRTSRHLDDPAAQRAAVFSYNPSTYYVDLVTAFERGYRTGVFVIPAPPAPEPAAAAGNHKATAAAAKAKARAEARARAQARRVAARKKAAHRAAAHRHAAQPATGPAHGSKPAPKPAPKPKPKPKPAPKPKPKPAPKPSPAPKPAPKPSPDPKPKPPAPTPPSPAPPTSPAPTPPSPAPTAATTGTAAAG